MLLLVGVILLILGIVLLFVPVRHRVRHGIDAGPVSVGVTTTEREKVWSIPRPVSMLAVAVLLEFCSCTTLAPSYRNFVVVPPTVFDTRRLTPS